MLAAVAVVTAVAMQLFDAEDAEPYGLGNTDLDGYAALASVLADEGVEIHRAYSAQVASDLLDEHTEASVVVLSHRFQPQQSFVSELAQQHQAGRDVLWLGEDALVLASMLDDEVGAGPPIASGAAGTAPVLEAGQHCTIEAALTAQSIRAPGETLRGDTGCFVAESADDVTGFALAETSHGLAFTAPEAFTNQHITEAGNSALALGLLGAAPEAPAGDLIWYTPSGADAAGADQWESPIDYLPLWFWPLTGWLLVCGLVAMAVAGRRYGPVVSEPLPVSVPASESAHGRGRLYQRSNSVIATAQTLRSAHLVRLGRLLRLGPAPPAEAIASATARESGWDEQRVNELLLTPNVGSNDQLTSYAQQLTRLENDLRDRTRMRRRPTH